MTPATRIPGRPVVDSGPSPGEAPSANRLRFNLTELLGSFGDLGTFIPLTVALVVSTGMDIGVILFCAGIMNIASGWLFRQPIAVQPMKAIAAVAISGALTATEVGVAGTVVGLLILILGLAGWVDRVERWIPRPVVRGLQLGVGAKLTLTGFRYIAQVSWSPFAMLILGAAILVGTLAFRKKTTFPGALILSLLGIVIAWATVDTQPSLGITWPAFSLIWPTTDEFTAALVHGALPQIPLTLLNSIVALCVLSADYFPRQRLTVRSTAISVGMMNMLTSPIGAMPMCHGSGGLAAQYRFGARTGGAVIMLGGLKVIASVSLGVAAVQLLGAFPASILGVMLILAGIELARPVRHIIGWKAMLLAVLTALGILLGNALTGVLMGLTAAYCIRSFK